MTRKEIFSLFIVIAVVSYGAYKFVTREYTETKSRHLMDTIVEISATSKNKNVGKDIEAIFQMITELEAKLNEYDDESYLGKINSSDDEVFEMDSDVYQMLKIAELLYEITGGSFDVTIKPVWDLWAFNSPDAAVPDSLLIKEKLKLVGFDKLRYDENKLFKPKGMQLTFGAIAKGYIIDKAIDFMQERQITKGFVNCRSSMSFFGYKISPLVYIQHPRKQDESIASFRINNLSVGTSGDYQQYFEIDGKRYHHILNSKTGMPVEHIFSTTVIAPKAAMSDGLATAIFTMNPEKALEKIIAMPQTNVVIYFEQNDANVSLKSEGIKELDFSENL